MSRLAAYVEKIPARYYPQISVHEHLDMALTYGLGGTHLKSDQEIPVDWKGLLSKSFHEPAELIHADMAYGFLSPVFTSLSKKGYRGKSEKWELPLIRKPFKVYALGGIDVHNINRIGPMGFDGAAVLGAIWREQSMEDRLRVFEELKIQCQQKQYLA